MDTFSWFLTGSSDVSTRSGRLTRPFCARALKFGKQMKDPGSALEQMEQLPHYCNAKGAILVEITHHTYRMKIQPRSV